MLQLRMNRYIQIKHEHLYKGTGELLKLPGWEKTRFQRGENYKEKIWQLFFYWSHLLMWTGRRKQRTRGREGGLLAENQAFWQSCWVDETKYNAWGAKFPQMRRVRTEPHIKCFPQEACRILMLHKMADTVNSVWVFPKGRQTLIESFECENSLFRKH